MLFIDGIIIAFACGMSSKNTLGNFKGTGMNFYSGKQIFYFELTIKPKTAPISVELHGLE